MCGQAVLPVLLSPPLTAAAAAAGGKPVSFLTTGHMCLHLHETNSSLLLPPPTALEAQLIVTLQ